MDDNNSIPVIDGELVDGHVQNGARVRGYAFLKYLPPPNKEHPDFYSTCHEFTPEESAQLDAHGVPLLFNHDGKLGLCGQILVDQELEDGSGARNALAVVHGEGDLAGEAFSLYMDESLRKKRYTKVSLQHCFWLDPRTPNGVRKKALEISICRELGRRPGAEILWYEPTSEKRSYIKTGKGVRGVSCAMSASLSSTPTPTSTKAAPAASEAATTPTPMSAPSPTADTPKKMEVDSPEQPQAPTPTAPPAPDLSKMTSLEMMQMVTRLAEEKRQAEEKAKQALVKNEELEKFRQEKLKQEAEVERKRQEEIERIKQEQRLKTQDLMKSYFGALNEQVQIEGEEGKPVIDDSDVESNMELINTMNDHQLAAYNKFLMCTSAANAATLKRLREQEEQAAQLEEEFKRQKMGHYQDRFNSAFTSSASGTPQQQQQQLSHPTSRFTNLPETMGKSVINEASNSNLFAMPKLTFRGSGSKSTTSAPTTPSSSSSSNTAAAQKKFEPPKTQEEAIQLYNEWFAEHANKVDRRTALEMLQTVVGTSAASADASSRYGTYTPPVNLTMQHTSPAAWNSLLQHMDRRRESGIPACPIKAE